MSIFGGRENIVVDWDDTILAGGELNLGGFNNISEFVSRIDFNYGLGVLTSPSRFTPTMLRGRIRLNRDLDHIPQAQLDRPHYFQYIIDDHVLLQALVHPVRNRTFKIASPNTALLRDPVDKSSVEPRADYWLWDEVLRQIGAERGPHAYFNGYPTHGGLRVRTSFAGFLRDIMTFGGGYVFEDKLCQLNFMAARAISERNFVELTSERHNPLFELTLTPKIGAVRNEGRSRIVRVNPFGRRLIRTYNLSLATGDFSQLFTPPPQGEIAGLWSVVISDPNPAPDSLRVTIENQDTDGMNFTVFNAGAEVDAVVEVYATTYSIVERGNFPSLNVESSILYGRQPLERFPDWGQDARPITQELERLRNPLQVSRVRMPITPDRLPGGSRPEGNPLDLLLYEVGNLFLVRDAERQFVMLLGRKHVRSREALELQWDLVELPQGPHAGTRGWEMDEETYTLGINTIIRGGREPYVLALGYNGREIWRGGQPILRAPMNPIMYNNKFIKRDGGFILRGDV